MCVANAPCPPFTGTNPTPTLAPPRQPKGFLGNLWTGLKIVSYPLIKPFLSTGRAQSSHAKDMESFYKFQKDGYDSFREDLLHARGPLMESIPLSAAGGMVWVDVGGGTARNLQFFSAETIRKYFKVRRFVCVCMCICECMCMYTNMHISTHKYPHPTLTSPAANPNPTLSPTLPPKAIYIVDISASLLEVAATRVKLMGLGDVVKVGLLL